MLSDTPHRRSLRLEGYDYSQAGAYFVTICTQHREFLFGDVVDGTMVLNRYGAIALRCWNDLSHHYRNMESDAFVVMPNHVHGIIILADPVGAGLKPAPTDSAHALVAAPPGRKKHPLSEIVRAFKTFSSRRINESRGTSGTSIWQRNYYEHIIRDDESKDRIREYIATNPLRWEIDRENPLGRGEDEFDRWLATVKPRPDMRS
ncbi:MAG: transposase [Nitrospinae bacterium]|nr:transposase [Nitrospinota bacterium]